jgi:hypothetical protein
LQAKVKPGKRSSPKKVAVGKAAQEGFNATTKAMAYGWVMKALDHVSADMKKELAAELGVKPANLINVSLPVVIGSRVTSAGRVDCGHLVFRAGTTTGSKLESWTIVIQAARK